MDDRRVSRRRFLQGTAAAGAGGLIIGGGVGAALGATLSGEGDEVEAGGSGEASGPPIKIGHPFPLTGPLAADGEEAQRTTTLAVEEINDRGGICGRSVEQVFADVGDLSPDKLRAAFTKLTAQDNVDCIIASYFYAPGPDMDVVADAEVPYIHHSAQSPYSEAVSDDPERYWMVFHGVAWEFPHGEGLIPVLDQIEATGNWRPRNRRAFIITSDNTYSTNIATIMRDTIREQGWDVAGFEQIVAPFTEWGPILENIRRTDPDLIFNTDFDVGDIAAFQIQFVQNPTNSLMYQQFAPSLPEYYELTGDRSTGVIYATLKGVLRDEIGRAFIERFTNRWDVAPGAGTAGIVHDSMWMYFEAVARAQGPEDRRRVAEELRGMIWRGVCGASTFNPENQTTPEYPTEEPDLSLGTPHLYIQLRDGQHEILSPETYATTQFEPPPWFA
ncbi:MAG: ABC transporter substrate-binding protein [Candidatus Binatia bacterium]